MKKIALLALVLLFFACDDGDLQIETLDFDSVDPQTCDTLTAEDSEGYVLFKINGDEALILELPASAFKNETVEDTLTVKASGSIKVTYRIFDDTVSNAYFCSTIPQGTPILTEEVAAKEGKVFISTETEDEMTYSHTIRLSAISLETGSGQRITDLSINEFGVVTTTKPIEAP